MITVRSIDGDEICASAPAALINDEFGTPIRAAASDSCGKVRQLAQLMNCHHSFVISDRRPRLARRADIGEPSGNDWMFGQLAM
ncbi:MAG: hypothetical protein ACLPGW_17045 [Roseiarcus sp.]